MAEDAARRMRQLQDSVIRTDKILKKKLNLQNVNISEVPPEVFELTGLTSLILNHNKLNVIPKEISTLQQLTELQIHGNRLTALPEELSKLSKLEKLGLSTNALTAIPPVIFKMKALHALKLSMNSIKILDSSIGELHDLSELRLSQCELTSLPPELGRLENLHSLKLRGNLLTVLPPEIGHLKSLESIDIYGNPIYTLPIELSQCEKLREIRLSHPELFTFPPADITQLGTTAILAYLRAAAAGSELIWESKLLLVGEGAVGKTWLYEAMNGRTSGGNRKDDGATIGIEIGSLLLQHPLVGDVQMKLNCWDFAGQDINHATHQFFFSERTLFVLCWNARAGWEAGKLRKWLTNIRDRAPGARVLLVATQCDQPHSDFPEKELRTEFPQIVDTFKTSSETGEGIERLLLSISAEAARLPMMGLRWPSAWRAAQQAIKRLGATEAYCSVSQVRQLVSEFGLDDRDVNVLLRWLHELGEVLHYAEVPELASTVMLDPQWVTQRVGLVLASQIVQSANGILTRSCLENLWPDLEPHVLQHLLGMMERFDLAYRIPEDQEHRCLVVERLPQNPPEYELRWKLASGQIEVRLRYRLKSMHPGIPTWFIARCHRFTLGLHWLRGVIFGDNRHSPRHLALITANESERTVDFVVRGTKPWTFLPLLTDGFEDTISKRYPGLEFDRIAPCPGKRRDGTQCDYEFNIEDLEELRWPEEHEVEPEYEIRCPRCRTNLDIDALLLGLSRETGRDSRTLDEILNAVRDEGSKTREHFSTEMQDARKFIQLSFVQEWNKAQELEEDSCPTVFALYPIDGRTLTRTSTLRLQLYCMNPDCWHSIGTAGRCDFKPKRQWLISMARWTRSGLRWIRPVAALLPSGSQLAGEFSEDLQDFADDASNELKFTAEVFKNIKDTQEIDSEPSVLSSDDKQPRYRSDPASLHDLRKLLETLEFPVPEFGGLKRVRTPEGHILWLCEEHANEFLRTAF
ncbi:MAG: hypothetical protein A2Z27_00115 [candidate division Zixibacteria bacterium RBG_16_50_21]|nr:MAG: hypothetical protein A2Z27_00115 [candidate division Zixibacteria bacterium RBG_16_50_21]